MQLRKNTKYPEVGRSWFEILDNKIKEGSKSPNSSETLGSNQSPFVIETQPRCPGKRGLMQITGGVNVDARVEFLKTRLKRDRSAKLSTESMARMVNLSTSHLAHLFRQDAKISPQRFAKLERMQHAKHLLETSFFSVKQVKTDSGFGDASHFVRDFKRLYGKSPGQYRREHTIIRFANKQQKWPIDA